MKSFLKLLRLPCLVLALSFVFAFIFASCKNPMDEISIQSYILRDRVVVTDRVFMKKALYVAFSLHLPISKSSPIQIKGTLSNGGKFLSDARIDGQDVAFGTIVFDLPYNIPSGQYFIQLEAVSKVGDMLGTGSLTVQRERLKMFFEPQKPQPVSALTEVPPPTEKEDRTIAPNEQGLIVFSRPPLQYVFSNSRPQESEVVEKFSIQTVRNKFELLSFSIYPLQSLGVIRVSVTDLVSAHGIIPKENIAVATITNVNEGVGLSYGYFQKLPTLVVPGHQAVLKKGAVQSFLITFKIGRNIAPGDYKGAVMIQKIKIPLQVRVLPITFEDIPNVQYFMLSTYEMTELVMPWRKKEQAQIYQSAVNIYKDYKEHGMTTIAPASPFSLFQNDAGQEDLRDILASVRAAKEVGFHNPIIWYMGQLIQTAKPKHPGNILGFDRGTHLDRLKNLVKKVLDYTRKNELPDILFFPIDESDDASQDPQGRRRKITPLLLEAIAKSGGKSVLTRQHLNPDPPDYLLSSTFNEEELRKAKQQKIPYFLYNNAVTTSCNNPNFARYIYGYYTWRNQIDGISSWTFQTTQNARGRPEADTLDQDIFLAYPHPNGPLATLKWEAIREGIDDHKAIYQFMLRKTMMEKKGMNVTQYDQLLANIRERSGHEIACQFSANGDSSWLQAYREKILAMVIKADQMLYRVSN